MGDTRRFPILCNWRHETADKALGVPKSVPWSMLAPHESQAERNHSQSLETLAGRGGLDVSEMVAVLTGQTWREVRAAKLTHEQAAAFVIGAVAAFDTKDGDHG